MQTVKVLGHCRETKQACIGHLDKLGSSPDIMCFHVSVTFCIFTVLCQSRQVGFALLCLHIQYMFLSLVTPEVWRSGHKVSVTAAAYADIKL